jgi:hypothetical protein
MFGIDDIFIAMAVSAIGTGISAYGSYAGGKSQADYYKAMAEANNTRAFLINRTLGQNIELTKRTEDYNIAATTMDASQQNKQLMTGVAKLKGTQKSTSAAMGVGGGSVTQADILTSTLDAAKMDEIAIRYNSDAKVAGITNEANNRIWGFENDAANEIYGLNVQNYEYGLAGKNAMAAGEINAAGSILSGAQSMANQYMMNGLYTRGGMNNGFNLPTGYSRIPTTFSVSGGS